MCIRTTVCTYLYECVIVFTRNTQHFKIAKIKTHQIRYNLNLSPQIIVTLRYSINRVDAIGGLQARLQQISLFLYCLHSKKTSRQPCYSCYLAAYNKPAESTLLMFVYLHASIIVLVLNLDCCCQDPSWVFRLASFTCSVFTLNRFSHCRYV